MRIVLTLFATAVLAAAASQDALRLHVEADPSSGPPTSEFVRVYNESLAPIGLDGFRVCDAIATCYAFAPATTLAPGDSITVVSGQGVDAPGIRYWGRRAAVWNNDGDVALLVDAAGEEVARFGYGAQPDVRTPGRAVAPRPTRPASPPPRRTCCRVCTTGKACGNSCISRSYTCRQPPGCACNGGDEEYAAAIMAQLDLTATRGSWRGLEPTSFLCPVDSE